MKTCLSALLRGLALATAILIGEPAGAALAPDQLADVGVRPPPGASLPLDARLTDLDGRSMTLGAAIGGRPSVVIFADYDCPQLCSPILALAGAALTSSGLKAGVDYRLVVIGFNPRASAADGKRMVSGQIGLDTPVGRATTALIASEPVASQLTGAVGYHYAYDAERGRYAHPVALLVVAADGRLSRVLSGLAISGADVRLALVEASKGVVGAIADQIRLLCYGFSASVGPYTDRVRILLGVGGVATLLAIAAGLILLARPAARSRT
jgi:protein SCO1/2